MNEQLFIAFDYGERRIGVAIGQALTRQARPLTTIHHSNDHTQWSQIDNVIREWQPHILIVGLPDDSQQNKTLRKKIRRFCHELTDKYHLPVHTHDETLSSDEAYLHLKTQRKKTKGKIDKAEIDQVAAAILLESWMNVNLPL